MEKRAPSARRLFSTTLESLVSSWTMQLDDLYCNLPIVVLLSQETYRITSQSLFFLSHDRIAAVAKRPPEPEHAGAGHRS